MSSASAVADNRGLHPVAPNPIVRFGMFTFLASEAMLFAGLIGAYIVLRVSQGDAYFPQGATKLPVLQTLIATVVLVASSFTCHWAEVRVRKGKRGTWALFLTIVLGSAFLANQAYEWNHLKHEGMWFNTMGTYASNFFVLTGFHGLHVFIGVLLLIASWLLSMAGKFDGSNHNFLECASLYWHFVDIVWIVVFAIIYLW
ncbi:MAG: heme-copper oxidase subunit III [Verrucomicrobia bacterium]|nr:heme-copper oxidase subunit III [Verrucomicrobiota bacterium]